MDHSFTDKVTWPMSQAKLSWYLAPSFIFTHCLCMNTARWPIPRGPETADTLVKLEKVTDAHLHSSRIRPCQPMERWFRADTLLVLVFGRTLVLRAARPFCRAWSCWLRFARLGQDLVRCGPGGSLTRDGSPSVSDGGCLWPSCFWGVSLPPHGYRHTSPGASVWVYPGFCQGCLKAFLKKAKKERTFLIPFFYTLPFFLPLCYLIGSPPQVGRELILSF